MNPPVRHKLFVLLVTLVIVSVKQSASAQSNPKWPISLSKGATITLKIPSGAISFEKVSIWSGSYSFTVQIDQNDEGYTVNGRSDWKDIGWPSQLVLYVNKVERKKEYTQVELDDVNGNHIKLRFMPSVKDINAALLALVHQGSLYDFQLSDYYQKEIVERFLPKIFKGPLAAIPREMQLQMIKGANYDLNAVGSETYKGRYFMVFRASASEVYNTIQLNQPARIARAIEKDVLSTMRMAYKALAEVSGLDGFKIELKVGHKNFVSEQYLPPYYDDLHIYTTKDVIKKFAEDDTTSQQFINESIVLVNGNRVDVSLTQFK
ncbi:hypothetical protein BH18ACI2_BH18ACI2_05440 [soil metagenome]